MLPSCYPPLSANSTSGPLRPLQKERREREQWPNQGHLLLDVLKLWNSERICTRLVSPRTFSFCTHIHTSFLNPAWMTATVSGPQKNFYLNNEEKVKETISNLLTVTNPTELLKGIWMWKVQQEQNFLKTEKRIAVGDLSERWFEIGAIDFWRPIYKTWKKKGQEILTSRECDIFRTQIGVDLGWPPLARSACPFPGNTVAKESHSNGLQEVLPVIP